MKRLQTILLLSSVFIHIQAAHNLSYQQQRQLQNVKYQMQAAFDRGIQCWASTRDLPHQERQIQMQALLGHNDAAAWTCARHIKCDLIATACQLSGNYTPHA